MAFSPASVLAKLIEDKETDIRWRRARTLDLLASKGQVRTADTTELRWNVIVGDSTTAAVTMATAGSNQSTGDTVQAYLPLGQYKLYHQFSINRVDMVDAASRGTETLRRLFKVHVDAGVLALRKKINELLWTGNGNSTSAGVVGMGKVLDTSYSYAGLSSTEWKPIINTNATARPLTKDLLNSMETLMEMEEVGYDTIVMNPEIAQKYRELFESIAGLNQLANVEARRADVYSGSLSWMGVPILLDRYCPPNQVVFFDSAYVEVLSFDLANSDRNQLNEFGVKDNFSTIDSADVGGLRINVALIPQTNPGTIDFQLFVIPQLKVSNRRMVQGILNLTTSSS